MRCITIAITSTNLAKAEPYRFHLKKIRKKITPARATIGPLEEEAYTKTHSKTEKRMVYFLIFILSPKYWDKRSCE